MSDVPSFIAAIRTGNLGAVEVALGANPDLARRRDESGVSVICLAIYFGRDEIARALSRASSKPARSVSRIAFGSSLRRLRLS